ncbi:MAG: hypothetical protein JO114_01225 [Planctomycetaceae bacterium]|nr:hypothetical protein [Planctomycetaceae bacterium]
MNFFKSLSRRENARTVGHRTRSARVGVEAMESKLLLSTAAAPTYSLYRTGQLYEQTAGRSVLLASNVKAAAVTSTDAVIYLEQNGTLIEQPTSGAAQVLDRLVSSFQLGSANRVNVVDWFNSNLSNAGICNLARADFTRDDALTFSDMLGIFDEVLQSGALTSTELQSLETLVAHATTLNMPSYVQNLAAKVVNPSTNDATYLEQYYGTTGVTLQETVNQWFLGKVEPNAIDTCDGSAAVDPNSAYTNVGATGYTLFGPNGPSFTDVAQGSAGDCWMLSSLAETAARDPQIIQNMFINNGNGTWTVRFYVNGALDYVTVNDQLPVATADPSYNGGYAFDAPQSGILWAALAEKAFAEENLSGGVTTGQQGVDSYAALNGGYPSWALAAITGMSSSEFNVTPGVTSQEIAAALQAGDLVCIGTPDSSDIDSYLVPGHCYAVVGYNPSSTMPFEVFNPWGINTYSVTNGATWGYFTSNGAFLEQNFVTGGVAGTAAPGAGPVNAMLSPNSLDRGAVANTNELMAITVDTNSITSTHESLKIVTKSSTPIATAASLTIHGRRGASLPGGPLVHKSLVADLGPESHHANGFLSLDSLERP